MILTHSMMVCHAQHLATNSHCQGLNFDSDFGEKSSFSEYAHVAYQRTSNSLNAGLPIKIFR